MCAAARRCGSLDASRMTSIAHVVAARGRDLGGFKVDATGSFNALGYASKKTLELKPNGIEGFMTESSFVIAAFTNNFRP